MDTVSVSNFDFPDAPLVSYEQDFDSPFSDTAAFVPTFTPTDNPGEFVLNEDIELTDGTLSVEINSADNGNNWVEVQTIGMVGLTEDGIVNRDGIGAVVFFIPEGGSTVMQPILGGSSHASQDSLAANFGLGEQETGMVEILWPGGVRNRFYDIQAGDKLVFPEIPVSFEGEFESQQEYEDEVGEAIAQLVEAEVITVQEGDKFYNSAVRAFREFQAGGEMQETEVKFNPAESFEVGDLPASSTTGDYDGDGNLDLATANSLDGSVSVLLGDGTGSFVTANHIQVGGYPFSIAAKLLNDGDSNLDLAVANLFSGDNVSALLGDGTGNFSRPFSFDVRDNLLAFAPIDLDDKQVDVGDERYGNDALVVVQSNSQAISLLYWDDSMGEFGMTTEEFDVGAEPFAVTTKDFNDDGRDDIATANRDEGSISLLLGDGSGGFEAPIKTEIGIFPSSLAAEDIDGDGNIDLAITDSILDEVSIFSGDGSGNFELSATFALRFSPSSVAAGDFNSDGKPDLAITHPGSNRVLILENITDPSDVEDKTMTQLFAIQEIFGTEENDLIVGTPQSDLIKGLEGNDLINDGMGNDGAFGNEGNDFFFGSPGNDIIRGGSGNDFVFGQPDDGSDFIDPGKGNNFILGGGGADTFVLMPDSGVTLIADFTLGEDKFALGGSLTKDDLNFTELINNSPLSGSTLISDADTGELIAFTAFVPPEAVSNADFVTAESIFLTGNSPDGGTENATPVNNQLPEALLGNIFGSPNSDALVGDDGENLILAGAGDDFVNAGGGKDRVFGEDGNDLVNGEAGKDLLNGGADADVLNGGKGADTLLGETGNDILNGDRGTDVLVGGSGGDVISGGKGNDLIFGGDGNDALFGDGGRDIFVFALGEGADIIFDFELGQDAIAFITDYNYSSLDFEYYASGDYTTISDAKSGELITTLVGVEADQLGATDFTTI